MGEADELEALRARAVCAEVLAGIGEGHGVTAALIRRLGELTDPERVEDANMLAGWKERYRRKITARTKSAWGRRLRWTGRGAGRNVLVNPIDLMAKVFID